jgi:glycosyltransferase involved in cell wall biosynthesis
MDLSIILPVFNEEENLGDLYREIVDALEAQQLSYEILFIDDASTDSSRVVIEGLAAADPRAKGIFFRRNAGQSAAFDAGFRHATGRLIVTMDADRQNDPKDIPNMIKTMDKGFDFVTGWRKDRQDGLFLRKIPSKIANWIIRRATGIRIHDLGCSLKIYKKSIASEIRLYGEMHRFISVLAKDVGARVGECVVNHRPRVAGKSKYGLGRTFKVMLDLINVWFMQRYKTKPLYVFGAVAGVLFLCALLSLGVVAWQKFILGVFVHRNPLFVVSLLSGFMGLQFIGMGLIAEILVRTYFESQSRHSYYIERKVGFVGSDFSQV